MHLEKGYFIGADPYITSPGIVCREQFGHLLNLRSLTRLAVEIGTHQAEFAETFLKTWKGRRLICVDPWQQNMPDYNDPVATSEREEDYQAARKRLEQFGKRARMWRTTSCDAARLIPNDTLDFVYIDGNHKAKYVRQDIALWFPRLRSTGILAGHDLNGDWAPQVEPVVREFAETSKLPVYFVLGPAASWYVIKP